MEILWSPWRNQYVTAEERATGCVFCRLAAGGEGGADADFDAAHFVLFRGRHNFVVLNLYPYSTAHLMVVPYAHVARLADADKGTTDELMDLAKRAERAIQAEYRPDGFNAGLNLGRAAGAGVAEHLHLHLLPRWAGDANFMTTVGEVRVLPEALADTHRKLKTHFLPGDEPGGRAD
jgi:ATP adenylyltransferase